MTYKAAIGAHRLSGKPFICHVHSTEFDRSGERVNQYIYDLEREAFHTATMNITVSEYTRRILLDRYGVPAEKVRTVHNGVEFNLGEIEQASVKGKRKVAPKGKVVTFVGRITFQKGPDYFVRAAKTVIENIPDVKFVMAGTGDMYYRMIDMAAAMGMGSYFHYTGFLDKNGVSKLYSISDLYVMPSVSEPFGITPLEAMLHKVPVIISKQSGVSEVIQSAIKIDFWDVNQISTGIIQVLKDKKIHKKMCEDGFSEATSIQWRAAAEKVNYIYEEALNHYAGYY
jgi:glycosyltransferase involved in cell wall biosynthesis